MADRGEDRAHTWLARFPPATARQSPAPVGGKGHASDQVGMPFQAPDSPRGRHVPNCLPAPISHRGEGPARRSPPSFDSASAILLPAVSPVSAGRSINKVPAKNLRLLIDESVTEAPARNMLALALPPGALITPPACSRCPLGVVSQVIYCPELPDLLASPHPALWQYGR